MAYKSLTSLALSNSMDAFQRMRDFMCSRGTYASTGAGWTYHDSHYDISETSISVDDYFVMYSTGEDGLRSIYVKVLYKASYIDVTGYLYWNNSTHAGVLMYGAINSYNNPSATNLILWIYADLDEFIFITRYPSLGVTYNTYGGWMPDSAIDQTVTTHASSIASGGPRTVTFTSVPGTWATNTELFVWDNSAIEKVIITGIAGNDVTFSNFVATYSSGASFCLEKTNYIAAPSLATTYMQIDHNGIKNVSCNTDYPTTRVTGVDGLSKKYVSKKIYLATTTNLIGPMKNIYYGPTGVGDLTSHTIGSDSYIYFLMNTDTLLIKEA